MDSMRLAVTVRRNFILLPVFVYMMLFWYHRTLPWCHDLADFYPGTLQLRGLRQTKPAAHNIYGYTHNPVKNCHERHISILSLVKSKPGNSRMREAVRNTWGKAATEGKNRLIFSLGKTKNLTLQKKIDDEAKHFNDILQANFEDSYLNLTIKTIHGIHWISTICPNAKFVIMVDEDVIVNYKNIQEFFYNVSFYEMSSLYTGYVNEYPNPSRSDTKFMISLEQYPFPCFPYYVTGPIILTTGKVIEKFDSVIPTLKPFVFEDVYQGIVALKVGIKISTINNHRFDSLGTRLDELPCLLSSHQGGEITGDIYEKYYHRYINVNCKRFSLG